MISDDGRGGTVRRYLTRSRGRRDGTSMAEFDRARIVRFERTAVVAGVVMIIASLLPWYTTENGSGTESLNAYEIGFLGSASTMLTVQAAFWSIGYRLYREKEPVYPAVKIWTGLASISVVVILVGWRVLRWEEESRSGADHGMYLALVASVGCALAGCRAWRELAQARKTGGGAGA